MMTDNDGNIVVDEDGYDYYYLDSQGRSRMMFLKLLFKVKLVHHCMFIQNENIYCNSLFSCI